MKPHQKLNAWIKGCELVKELYVFTNTFPVAERFGLTSQIRRAAVSVPVNIAEGAARKGKKEFIYFLYISLGSLTELDTLLHLSNSLGFGETSDIDKLNVKCDRVGKMIYGLIKNLERP
ncbi:four helix bundle protein [Flavobacterium silvaticum]|uniref:Four helix bundle protein n=1 Tax=Flavobacterium silvaticum TaxID=1852020 RepID=A0A972FW88_9FLAO|nr:four helix bundle protein [Flavobacterium silvaticum]NMH28775.1 four helix bundle protein [Flavobacterium silvaticum]